jgi:hypothetical protein
MIRWYTILSAFIFFHRRKRHSRGWNKGQQKDNNAWLFFFCPNGLHTGRNQGCARAEPRAGAFGPEGRRRSETWSGATTFLVSLVHTRVTTPMQKGLRGEAERHKCKQCLIDLIDPFDPFLDFCKMPRISQKDRMDRTDRSIL